MRLSADVESAPERRLHPLSFLFGLTSKGMAVPLALVVVLCLGVGDLERDVGGALTTLAMLAIYRFAKSLRFSYRLTDREIVVREGLLARSERHIPFDRIQSVVQHQNLVHRAFGVVELRLESAGSVRPEAVMSVISVAAALVIDNAVRARAGTPAPASEYGSRSTPGDVLVDAVETSGTLFTMSLPEVLRLGLVSNRGWRVVSGVLVLLASLDLRPLFTGAGFQHRTAWLSRLIDSPAIAALGLPRGIAIAVTIALGGLVGLLVLKALSIVNALVTFFGFRLESRGSMLMTRQGLLERRSTSVSLDRIQRVCVGEPWVARLMNRRWLACAVNAGGDKAGDESCWMVPLGRNEDVDRALRQLAPTVSLSTLRWRPLPTAAWRRRAAPRMIGVVVASLPLIALFGTASLLLMTLLLMLVVLRARAWARWSAWALERDVFAFRSGSWSREWRLTWLDRGHTVELLQSPMDRRFAMAEVLLDTPGEVLAVPSVRIPYLGEQEARTLANELRREVAARTREAGPASSAVA
jgi:putative membrane protein